MQTLRSSWKGRYGDRHHAFSVAAAAWSFLFCGLVAELLCVYCLRLGPAGGQKRENMEALVNQLKSKLQWESEARERAEDQIRHYKDEVRARCHVAAVARLVVRVRTCSVWRELLTTTHLPLPRTLHCWR